MISCNECHLIFNGNTSNDLIDLIESYSSIHQMTVYCYDFSMFCFNNPINNDFVKACNINWDKENNKYNYQITYSSMFPDSFQINILSVNPACKEIEPKQPIKKRDRDIRAIITEDLIEELKIKQDKTLEE